MQRLYDMLWATRGQLVLDLPEPAAAVAQAMASDRFPVVLVEMGDNIGGGSAGDATFILSEMLRQKASGWVTVIADPEAVQEARIGQPFDEWVGGKTDRLHGEPVHIRGTVKSMHDGKYMETAVRHGGQRYLDQGLTTVVEVEGKPSNDLMSRKVKSSNAVAAEAIGKGFIPITLDDVDGFLVRTILFRVIENEMVEFATAVEIEGKPYSTRIHDATVCDSIALEVEIDWRLNDSRVGCWA
jgi:hypothetical protein